MHCKVTNTVVPGFRVLGFSALPGFRALKAGDEAWSVHKALFGFRAPLSQLFIQKISDFYCKKLTFFCKKLSIVGVWMFVTVKSLLLFGLNFEVPSNHQDCIYKLHKTPLFFAVRISTEPYCCQILDLEFKVL